MDFDFQSYNNRQFTAISDACIEEASAATKPGNKFIFQNGKWHPLPYEGYAIITMVDDNEQNKPLSNRIHLLQIALAEKLQMPDTFYFLPKESFHQTVANTLSAEKFQIHIAKPGLEANYPQIVQQIFDSIPRNTVHNVLPMKMLGLSIFGTAIGMLGMFEDEAAYQNILHFRKYFYTHPALEPLHIKMTRPFIGHITIGYIEQNIDKKAQSVLATSVQELNHALQKENNIFYLSQTSLRHYKHLAAFEKAHHYPTFNF
ncbi:hypothetical protein ACFOW1_11505 [Parasediminibacterium paludis]|uniref:Uncharacterized protein n=1 Tax=Parasediminibacterium paludis TaxID=908966 RepID=A0ABV8PZX5_9BACT